MKRGKFIVFESIDGGGKTTQAKLLDIYLTGKDIPHVMTHEPSDGPIGSIIEKDFLTGEYVTSRDILDDLFELDRRDRMSNPKNGIIMHLDRGEHVISDRFSLSGLVYKTFDYYGNSVNYHDFIKDEVERMKSIFIRPDITFYIDASPHEAMKRIKARNNNISIYEGENKLYTIHRIYDDVIKYCGDYMNVHRIEDKVSAEYVHSQVMDYIRKGGYLWS